MHNFYWYRIWITTFLTLDKYGYKKVLFKKTFCNTEYVSICCFKKSSAHEMFQKYNDWSSLWRHASTVLHVLMFNIFKCTYFCNHYRKASCHIYKYSSEKHFKWIPFLTLSMFAVSVFELSKGFNCCWIAEKSCLPQITFSIHSYYPRILRLIIYQKSFAEFCVCEIEFERNKFA